jgi:hypothetical protein
VFFVKKKEGTNLIIFKKEINKIERKKLGLLKD